MITEFNLDPLSVCSSDGPQKIKIMNNIIKYCTTQSAISGYHQIAYLSSQLSTVVVSILSIFVFQFIVTDKVVWVNSLSTPVSNSCPSK